MPDITTGLGLREVLRQYSFTLSDVAARTEIHLKDLEAWGSGGRRPTKNEVRRLREALQRERLARLEAAGLPVCDAVEKVLAKVPGELSPREGRAQIDAHLAACQICQARQEWARENLPPLPDPPRGILELVMRLTQYLPGGRRLTGLGILVSLLIATGTVAVLRVLPKHPLGGIPTYFVALISLLTLSLGIYQGLSFLHGYAVTRWAARVMAACSGVFVFVSVFMLAGYQQLLVRGTGTIDWSGARRTALAMGLMYATLWPIVSMMSRTEKKPERANTKQG